MKSLALSAIAAAALFAAAVPASAAPAFPKASGIELPSSVTKAGWRCGRGWHWSYRWRRCVRNHW